MKMMLTSLTLVLIAVLLAHPDVSNGQESVDVPRLLQKNVRAFKLTVDSLQTLTSDVRQHTRSVMQELRTMQQKMELLPKNSRAYRLQYKEYEQRLSEYWARKHAMLQSMEVMRQRTLRALDNVLNHLQSPDPKSDAALVEQVLEEVRKTEDRIAQTRLEMLQILQALEKPDIRRQEKQRLTRKFHLLQNDNLALYQAHHQRLNELNTLVQQPNSELPAVQQALLMIRDDLQSRYVWVVAELAYLDLYARYRAKWLDIDSRLVEVSGMVERFGDMVRQLNANRDLIQEVEDFERQLRPVPDGASTLAKLPPLQWPGKPEQESEIHEFTQIEIDSLRQKLQRELRAGDSDQSHP